MTEDIRETTMGEAMAKVTIEIIPAGKGSRVKKFQRVMEFPVTAEDLPLRLSAKSSRKVVKNLVLSEEMCED